MRTAFGVSRLLAASAGMTALIGDFAATAAGNPLAAGNFFSYFTVQSAILTVCVIVVAAAVALRGGEDPLWLDMTRVLTTCWSIVSGIVFGFILLEGSLRGIPVWAPWSSQLLHFWIPAYALLDWLVAPGRDVPWRTIGLVMAFPVVWLVYTMIRGPIVYWYPYFFLDPALVEVPGELTLYLLAVVAVFTAVVTVLIAVSRLRRLELLRARLA